MVSRDRDELGRACAALWAGHLREAVRAFPRIPDDLELPPVQTLAYAQDLLNRGLAFNAHEVLETAWKTSPDDERALWQSLAQLAVGITHVQRGNVKGALTVLHRASAHLAQHDRPAPYAIDAAGLNDHVDALIEDLQTGAEVSPERVRPRLVIGQTP